MTRTQHMVVGLAVGVMMTSVGVGMAGAQARPGRMGNAQPAFYRLTGTYQLNSARGDDPQRAAQLAARGVPPAQRQRTYDSLLSRLQAPDGLKIERYGNRVTMASTNGPRVSLDADGADRAEQWSTERTMNTRATLQGEQLVVTSTGYRGNAFTVTFDPLENGRVLRMTRTIDDERLRGPVTVRSFYRRTSNEARWTTSPMGSRDPDPNVGPGGREAMVPDGTRFVMVLDTALSTTHARDGDRYSMTARSPSQYEGAIIQGSVSTMDQSGRMNGGAGITLSLESIRLRDGTSYPFEGVIEDVRTMGGDAIRIHRGSTIDNNNRTQETVERGVIGAALGALIGAVAGGGKGAAIGAVIGAGGGAATVMIEGRDRLDLPRGTELTITSGDPRDRR